MKFSLNKRAANLYLEYSLDMVEETCFTFRMLPQNFIRECAFDGRSVCVGTLCFDRQGKQITTTVASVLDIASKQNV